MFHIRGNDNDNNYNRELLHDASAQVLEYFIVDLVGFMERFQNPLHRSGHVRGEHKLSLAGDLID